MSEATGSLLGCVIDGMPFAVMSDSNINFKRSKYEKEGTATSGDPLIKFTKRIQIVESLGLGCEPAEMEILAEKADAKVSVPISFELADGSIYRGVGHIHFDGYESETGKVSLTLIPTGEWTPFIV